MDFKIIWYSCSFETFVQVVTVTLEGQTLKWSLASVNIINRSFWFINTKRSLLSKHDVFFLVCLSNKWVNQSFTCLYVTKANSGLDKCPWITVLVIQTYLSQYICTLCLPIVLIWFVIICYIFHWQTGAPGDHLRVPSLCSARVCQDDGNALDNQPGDHPVPGLLLAHAEEGLLVDGNVKDGWCVHNDRHCQYLLWLLMWAIHIQFKFLMPFFHGWYFPKYKYIEEY